MENFFAHQVTIVRRVQSLQHNIPALLELSATRLVYQTYYSVQTALEGTIVGKVVWIVPKASAVLVSTVLQDKKL
jgi:hypothetical protein